MRKLKRRTHETGFSLVEVLIAMGILLLITTFVIGAFTKGVKSVRREKGLADRDKDVKRAMELISAELGQAGVTPEILNTDSSIGPKINANIAAGVTSIGIQGPFRGLYPGRPLILGLPEGDSLHSETEKILSINSTDSTVILSTPTTMAHWISPPSSTDANGNISSPVLPNPFGILNPPPLTAGTPPGLPLTSLTKQVNRIGFVGDILGDGVLQYVEYYFSNDKLYRSITPISESQKHPSDVLLDYVKDGSFTIVYPNVRVPVPVSVRISVTSRSSVLEKLAPGMKIDPNQSYLWIVANSEVMTRGTAAAALVWQKSGENELRNMLPPCSSATGYPPCNWSSPWWSNVTSFATGLP